ncbi:MarR family winged helix-turn-helix transcriptional regulator [Cupriavidus plantarum]|uniref:DNA-binding MarR family transcriptional regulator n=1 Tax=Cupriavidus plantarum TaxID=942865 RepID=A0A316EP99_9BURK|nr:MarR family transcriptional regulator [Cupriavidus plantarum]NYI01407.1 DNA-binding MarR family transcriptional regulator [Cupriavidus plantarum]PWK32630.1 DNA-binding MarR family transcriptional regulator [Cupriavidus plantarum]RLK33397.1 DNA-binding MarR family transcriptional regulator [Cupriavidus plantarum]CAG2151668.1 Multiple antibiotic resistance protein MarR [Cupriavidus plantarum]SMR85114.1 DNA-binding transcriptional regulator, MarR family [Cupriavidus plantarum]
MKHYTRKNYELTESIGFLLNKARNGMLMEVDAALRPLEITGQQMGILLALVRGEVSTPLEISRALGIDTGLTTRMLDKLENKDLVQRRRCEEDRRVVHVLLTQKGTEVARRIPDVTPDVLNRRLEDFTIDEFNELLRLLKKFTGDDLHPG